jgi:hypothetical protein
VLERVNDSLATPVDFSERLERIGDFVSDLSSEERSALFLAQLGGAGESADSLEQRPSRRSHGATRRTESSGGHRRYGETMTDEPMWMGVPDEPLEPFAQLLELLDESNGYEAADLDAWREEHAVTASLEPVWSRCGDPRLLLLVRGLAARTDAPEDAWRRIAVALCASARALAAALPPGELRPLRVLEAAEAWTRGECSVAHVRETYDAHCADLVAGDGHSEPTLYSGYDHALDIVTGPLEAAPLDGRVGRVALRLLLEHSIRCVDAITDHEGGGSSAAGGDASLVPPAVLAMFCAAAAAYFAHFLDLLPASRQAPRRDRRRTVAGAAGTMIGGIAFERSASFYAARARLADALRAHVRCPRWRDVRGG